MPEREPERDEEARTETDLQPSDPARSRTPSRTAWVALALVLLATALVRLRVLDAPLERDEGEYAYAGQLLLQGIPPYADVYNMKLPGIYVAYAALLAVFPDTPGGIHAGLLLVNAVTIVVIFLLGRRLVLDLGARGEEAHGPPGGLSQGARADLVGVTAGALFAGLTLGKEIQGFFANSEHFVVLPALAGILFLLRALRSERLGGLALSGLLLGCAFLVKQHGGLFALFGFLWLAWQLATRRAFATRRIAALAVFVAAGFAPLLVVMGGLAAAGIFDAFWWWTFEYARDYVGQVPLEHAVGSFKANGMPVIRSAPLAWAAAGLGLSALVWHRGSRGQRVFVALLFVLSFLAICPGFFFRPHYFVLWLPAVALSGAVGIVALGSLLRGRAWIAVGVVTAGVLAHPLVNQAEYLFRLSPRDVTRHTFPMNPFAESLEVARIVSAYSEPGDKIAVLGSEPQIAFYARRQLATGFVYMYHLMEGHAYAETLQRQLIEEVERNDPEIIVAVNVYGSWLGSPADRPILRDWIQSLMQRYARLSVVSVDPQGLGLTGDLSGFNVLILKKQ